jgi:hypothetical protein
MKLETILTNLIIRCACFRYMLSTMLCAVTINSFEMTMARNLAIFREEVKFNL